MLKSSRKVIRKLKESHKKIFVLKNLKMKIRVVSCKKCVRKLLENVRSIDKVANQMINCKNFVRKV